MGLITSKIILESLLLERDDLIHRLESINAEIVKMKKELLVAKI